MKLETLPKSNETKARKRVGRGPGSGIGKTAGRGENGQKSRSGASYRRVPKRGFNNKRFEVKFATINLSDLNKYFKDNEVVTPEVLKEKGIIKKQLAGVKVLGSGELTHKLTVKANRFSSSAVTKIENAGGKAEVI